MKRWEWTSLGIVIFGITLATMLSVVQMHAAEKSNGVEEQHSPRVFKFKTSDPNGMNIETQTLFQPGHRAQLKVSVQSGTTTNIVEFTVKSEMDAEPPRHEIEAFIYEKRGDAKRTLLRHPRLKTIEKHLAEVQINQFYFSVLIDDVK